MRNRRAALRALAQLAAAAATAGIPPSARPLDRLPGTIRQVKPSVVGVGTFLKTRRPPGRFTGTGFVVGDGRHVVTNAHVLPESLDSEKREFVAVLAGTGKGRVVRAEVVETDPIHDLALLSIGERLPAMRVRDSADVAEGELYAFTGFPIGIVLGMYPVTHRGIVSTITPIAVPQLSASQLTPSMVKRLRDPYEVFQLDATAYPGNSGSPLYDVGSGEVVGVINRVFVKESKEAILEKPSGITYAIPSRYVLELMRRAGLRP